jgi:hypothetical protein
MKYAWRHAAAAAAFVLSSLPVAAQNGIKPCQGTQCPQQPLFNPVQPFVGIQGGYGWNGTTFTNVLPQINFDGSGGAVGVNAGILFNVPNTYVFVGPRVGALFTDLVGDIFNPPASPGATYSTKIENMNFVEIVL